MLHYTSAILCMMSFSQRCGFYVDILLIHVAVLRNNMMQHSLQPLYFIASVPICLFDHSAVMPVAISSSLSW